MNLEKKNIIITGASSGIGRTCALKCHEYGATVHLIARNRERLDDVASQLDTGRFSVNEFDVTMSDGIEQVVKSIVKENGKIDGFIYSAGIQRILPMRNQDKQHFIDVFSVNTFAAFDFSRVITKKVNTSISGVSIVFISSVMSVVSDAGLTSYCASKAALVGGARAMAIELAPRNIRVNCVSPGTVEDTNMTKGLKESVNESGLRRIIDKYPAGLGSTSNVAELCAFLLSDKSKWITGQNIVIDGGYSVW